MDGRRRGQSSRSSGHRAGHLWVPPRNAPSAAPSAPFTPFTPNLQSALAHPSTPTPTVSQIPVKTFPIEQTDEYLQKLRALVPSLQKLSKKGFTVKPLPHNRLATKKKCQRCNKTVGNGKHKVEPPAAETPPEQAQESTVVARRGGGRWRGRGRSRRFYRDVRSSEESSTDLGSQSMDTQGTQGPLVRRKKNSSHKCLFHDGVVYQKHWTCCNSHVSAKPCKSNLNHLTRIYAPGELESLYQCHLLPAPAAFPSTVEHRVAVSIDCEMGVSHMGDSELIRVTAVDYFAGIILIDKLVYPDVPMQHFNTRYSGITRAQMEDAYRNGRCLMGRGHARSALARFVGMDTIVVGHAVHGDLNSLRWIHTNVVDTLLVEERRRKAVKDREEREREAMDEAEDALDLEAQRDADPEELEETFDTPAPTPPITEGEGEGEQQSEPKKFHRRSQKGKPGGVSLKALTADRLGRTIQTGAHDSVEDAVATRDLLHWMIMNPPPEGEPFSDDDVEGFLDGNDDDLEEFHGYP